MFIIHLYNDGEILKPVLTRRSVHNTRIEQLWREVHCVVGLRFKDIFEYLEAQEYLDIDNFLDI